MRKSWTQYAEDWQDSMNQAFDIARKHAVASGERNKVQYDKRVRGSDIVVGDRVLYRNREKGGTGKLRNFWDSNVFVVCGKEEKQHSDKTVTERIWNLQNLQSRKLADSSSLGYTFSKYINTKIVNIPKILQGFGSVT